MFSVPNVTYLGQPLVGALPLLEDHVPNKQHYDGDCSRGVVGSMNGMLLPNWMAIAFILSSARPTYLDTAVGSWSDLRAR
jgi:hypothetical protein